MTVAPPRSPGLPVARRRGHRARGLGDIEGSAGWPVDAIVIATIVLLNGVLVYVQEAKADNAVAALARMTAATSAVRLRSQIELDYGISSDFRSAILNGKVMEWTVASPFFLKVNVAS